MCKFAISRRITLKYMKNKLLILSILAIVLSGWMPSYAQDNNAIKINDKLPVSTGEKTDFIFTRSILIGSVAGAPFDVSRSGAYSIGVGYGIPIGKTLEIKLEPRASWHKLYFKPQADKTFPTAGTDSSLIYEKLRAFYVEVPLGLKFKLARNTDDKYKLLLEAGFSFGFNAGSTAKTRRKIDIDGNGTLDTKVTTKVHDIPELNALRYGPYARIGTNWITFYGFYRLTDIFDPSKKIGDDISGTAYPAFPQVEIGFSIVL